MPKPQGNGSSFVHLLKDGGKCTFLEMVVLPKLLHAKVRSRAKVGSRVSRAQLLKLLIWTFFQLDDIRVMSKAVLQLRQANFNVREPKGLDTQ